MKTEAEIVFDRWLDKTGKILHDELLKQGVGVSDELKKSLRTEMRRLGEGYLEGRIIFLERGRFVDMGSGRGYSMGRRLGSFDETSGRKGRRAKKWYSRAFYGRLNDLEGVLGIKLMEQAVEAVKVPLKAI